MKKSTNRNLWIGAALLASIVAGVLFAAPVSIQTLINSAAVGDVVMVLPGDYTSQNRILVNKAITLKCVVERVCIIRGANLASGANMDGFYSLDNPLNDGGIVGANNNDITNNFVTGSCMVGIKVSGSNSLVANNEVVRSKQCAGSSGPDADGIRFFGSGHVIEWNFIHDIRFADSSGSPHVDCFQTWGGAADTLIENNICDNYGAVIGANNGTSGANLENDVRTVFRNNYFHVYGKGILFESSSSGGIAENNIFVSGPVIAGTTGGQYCLFGNSKVTGNICYLYKAGNVLVAGASGTGNINADPKMSGYCSLAYPSKGIPCDNPKTPTGTPTLINPSATPSLTATPSLAPVTLTVTPIRPTSTPHYITVNGTQVKCPCNITVP